ncbi:CmcJ/NvfI family oxidoreductase [Geodermatophilus sp. CPCC 206100]|uniref:CmcJ/NvfI family oxidoreductase n=1 Tax=Geodermatophilus sp. CPCC 206100 TaxID=3020054 RepID=UPI003B003BB8
MSATEQRSELALEPVLATINYSVPSGQRPRLDNDDYSRSRTFLTPAQMPVVDGAGLPTPPALDAEGFARLAHQVDVSGVADSDDARTRYIADMKRFMLELTGADEVLMAPRAVVRRQTHVAATTANETPTVDFAHSDFSFAGGPDPVTGGYGVPSRTDVRRTAHFNQWRLLSPGPTERPLALCDARTLAVDDVIPGDSVFPARDWSFEIAFIGHNPAHRWVYFPTLTSEQVLVFTQADSEAGRPRVVPHTAFTDPSCPPGAAPRISVETRCIAVWYG